MLLDDKIIGQVIPQYFNVPHVTLVNILESQGRERIHFSPTFHCPHPETIHIVSYSDRSFAMNNDGSFHFSYIILLVDGSGRDFLLSSPAASIYQ